MAAVSKKASFGILHAFIWIDIGHLKQKLFSTTYAEILDVWCEAYFVVDLNEVCSNNVPRANIGSALSLARFNIVL